MRNAKVTYANGDIITTCINGTNESIKEYFQVGKVFNIGNNGEDNLQAVISCEVLAPVINSFDEALSLADVQITAQELLNGRLYFKNEGWGNITLTYEFKAAI